MEIDEALKLVAYAAGVEYTTRGSSLIVTPKGVVSSLEAPVTVQLPLKHARTGDVAAALAMTAPNTRLQADARTNSFIAQGPAGEIESLRKVLALLDVPVEGAGGRPARWPAKLRWSRSRLRAGAGACACGDSAYRDFGARSRPGDG